MRERYEQTFHQRRCSGKHTVGMPMQPSQSAEWSNSCMPPCAHQDSDTENGNRWVCGWASHMGSVSLYKMTCAFAKYTATSTTLPQRNEKLCSHKTDTSKIIVAWFVITQTGNDPQQRAMKQFLEQQVSFLCCDEHHDQCSLGKKGFISAYSCPPSAREVRNSRLDSYTIILELCKVLLWR